MLCMCNVISLLKIFYLVLNVILNRIIQYCGFELGSSSRSSHEREGRGRDRAHDRTHERTHDRDRDLDRDRDRDSDDERERTIVVGGIPSDITDVRKYFGQFGKVASTDLRKTYSSGNC